MEEHLTQTIERLAAAAEAFEAVLSRMDAQHAALNTKVDRIVATLDETATATASGETQKLEARVAELERENAELKAQSARPQPISAASPAAGAGRKTLSPLTSALLSKTAEGQSFDGSTLDKVLAPLSLEQRIAVKAEMARAGMIE